MNDTSVNASAGGRTTARQIAGELARAIQLRRDLADLEISHDRALLKRFLLVGGLSVAIVLSGVPLLLTAIALGLSQVTEVGLAGWLIFFGAVLVVPGTVALVLAIRKLRSEFCGLQNTRAELREDLVWVREWADQGLAESANRPTPAE